MNALINNLWDSLTTWPMPTKSSPKNDELTGIGLMRSFITLLNSWVLCNSSVNWIKIPQHFDIIRLIFLLSNPSIFISSKLPQSDGVTHSPQEDTAACSGHPCVKGCWSWRCYLHVPLRCVEGVMVSVWLRAEPILHKLLITAVQPAHTNISYVIIGQPGDESCAVKFSD